MSSARFFCLYKKKHLYMVNVANIFVVSSVRNVVFEDVSFFVSSKVAVSGDCGWYLFNADQSKSLSFGNN